MSRSLSQHSVPSMKILSPIWPNPEANVIQHVKLCSRVLCSLLSGVLFAFMPLFFREWPIGFKHARAMPM